MGGGGWSCSEGSDFQMNHKALGSVVEQNDKACNPFFSLKVAFSGHPYVLDYRKNINEFKLKD